MNDEEREASTAAGRPRPLAIRLAMWAGVGVAIVLVLWGTLHVAIPPVHPDRRPPAGHWGGNCGNCHIVSEKAPLDESD